MKGFHPNVSFLLYAVLSACLLCGCADTSAPGSSSVSKNVALTSAASITLSDDAVTIQGDGATEENGVITIADGGTYTITGSLSDGRILVNAPKKDVTLVLEHTDITCSYGSPVYICESSSATIYLTEGTTNTLSDGSVYTFEDSFSSAAEEEPNACLYSKSDLAITGSGQLTVNASYNNGITGKNTLEITDASITVAAKNHGLNGKDSCTIQNADLRITSGGDALRSTNDSDSSLGFISITDSVLELTAGEDGIQTETALLISDGTFTLDSCDDAIHSNGNVQIDGGTFIITSGDDAVHADQNVLISDGTITIQESYEGIEGESVDISGGTIRIKASDDGINAAGGADQSGFGQRQDTFAGSSDCSISIRGGIITIDASGDGVDSNGDLTVSGGELYVSGPESSGNGALDYNGSGVITGGIVVAAGSGGMSQNFGGDSSQGSMLLSFSDSSSEPITLEDSSGTILVSYAPSKSYNCVVISCPSVTQGSTYTVAACGETTSVTMDSLIYGASSGMGKMGNRQPGAERPFDGEPPTDMQRQPGSGGRKPENGEKPEDSGKPKL